MLRAPTISSFVLVASSVSVVAAESPTASGRVLTFLASPPAQQAADPVVPLPFEPFDARAGDVLTALVRVPDERDGARGVEVSYADGRRSLAARPAAAGAWELARVPLREGGRVERIDLVARGFAGAQVVFQVDDVRVERADGTAIELFRDDLPGAAKRVAGLATSAGAIVVDLAETCGATSLAPASDVGDPWAAIDLSALRALDREGASPASADHPKGLVWTGPCVPLRFARDGERASFAARGQRIGLDPLDGGRFYELWLAVQNTSDETIDARIAVHGVERERFDVALRVPARGPDGYAPGEGDGYPARDYALIEVDLAASASLASIQLPDDARLRVLAITIAWRRDGAVDPRFRARWLARATARPEMTDADRADVERYLANRRAGVVFGGVAGEGDAERALFDALLAQDQTGFRARLAERLAAQTASAEGRKNGRIELIATLPRADDDIAAALAEGLIPDDVPVLAGDAAALEALAARDPAAFGRLVARAKVGLWRAFDATLGKRASARLGADGLARAIASERVAARRLLGLPLDGRANGLARVEGDLGRLENLPQILASAGFGNVVVDGSPEKIGSTFLRWSSSGAEVVAIAPTMHCEGPLRFDPVTWRAWAAAAAGADGRPPIPVLCDVSAPAAKETIALAADLDRSEVSPDLAWSSIDEVARSARVRAQRSIAAPLRSLARESLRAELDALAAVREAERELARAAVVESLAVLDGAPAPGRQLAPAWHDLEVAAEADARRAAPVARAIAERVRAAAAARLSRLKAASPPAGPGVPLAVLDCVPWARRTMFELADGELRVASASGDLPMQRTANGGVLVELAGAGTSPTALLVRRDPYAETNAPTRVRLEGWRIRTDELSIAIDPASGRIARLSTVAGDVPLLRDTGIDLAWVAPGSAPEPIDELEKLEYVERGPLRAVIKSVRSSARARVETEIRVTPGAAGVEIRTRTELFDRGGDVVVRVPLAHASANAIASIPLGMSAVAPDAERLLPLDGWAAATDGAATLALLGEGSAAWRWNDRAFDVVVAESGAEATRDVSFRVVARAGGWRAAGLEATAQESALDPLRVAFDAPARPGAAAREPLLRVTRVERDGRRTSGAAAGVLPLAIEPGPDGTIEVRLVELRGESAHFEVTFAREPFGAERVDLAGNVLGPLVVTGRGIDVAVAEGRLVIVRARLSP